MPIIDFTNVEKVYRGSVEMKKVYEGSTMVWEKPIDNKSIPLYIELVNPTDTVPLQIMASGYTMKTLSYSYDNQNWTGYTATNNPYTIQLNSSNPRVYFRATTDGQWNASNSIYWYFKKYDTASVVPLRVGGNIYSLENTGTSYQTVISPRGNYSFFGLFRNFTCLTDASKLFLGESGSILTNSCYYNMFSGCTSLTQAPALPATTLVDYCYCGMFDRCSSLTQAPALPARILATYCYDTMFNECTHLTQAPELPATTLKTYCYTAMFWSCTHLTQAPELPATTLANYCYANMFRNCSSLNYIKCLATNISAASCTLNWVSGVSATGTFVKASSMSSWTTGVSGRPSGWTVINA